MVVLNRFLLLLLGASLVSGCRYVQQDSNTSVPNFHWQQSYLGGGGYITGMVQHPVNPEIIFARCDVAGLFKSEDGAMTWRLVNRGLTMGYHHNTESVCISPHDPKVMFRASGEARNHQMVGEIHKSIDGGESWYSVTTEIDFFGNGPNRMLAERIAIDPSNASVVIAGGFRNGMFISYDAGENWQYTGLENEPIVSVVFHPYQQGVAYVATLHDLQLKNYLHAGLNFNRQTNGRLFKSTDSGNTWELIYEKENLDFTELGFFQSNPDKLVASTKTHGIIISVDGGRSFTAINTGLPYDLGFNTIAVDHSNPAVMYTAADRRGIHEHVPLVPLYVTRNGGESWSLLSKYQFEHFMDYPAYIRNEEYIGWAISKIVVDSKNSQRLFMANWYGVSVSNDGGMTWSGNNFQGTETVCIESMVVDIKTEGRSGFTMPDHRPFVGIDSGHSYDQIATVTEYKNSTVLLFSRFNRNLILFASKKDWMGLQGSAILLSRDGGKNFGVVRKFENGLTVQAIQEDPHRPGRFYAYIDRSLELGAGLYKSDDWGENWEQTNLRLCPHIKTLPHQMHFVENELLSVTYGQQKNVCGTNQMLCLDPTKEGVIYFGEWTEGLYKTEDGGLTWLNVGERLPFKRDTTSVLVDIKADPAHPGRIYAGFIREGLWRSDDYGDSWQKIFPEDARVFNASSIAVGGYNSAELVVVSEPLYWSPCESAVYYSSDSGNSWHNIYDNRFGALRWKSVGIDATNGTIYGVTCGNGAFYASREN